MALLQPLVTRDQEWKGEPGMAWTKPIPPKVGLGEGEEEARKEAVRGLPGQLCGARLEGGIEAGFSLCRSQSCLGLDPGAGQGQGGVEKITAHLKTT